MNNNSFANIKKVYSKIIINYFFKYLNNFNIIIYFIYIIKLYLNF